MQPATRLPRAGDQPPTCFNSVVPSLCHSATFRFEDVGGTKGGDYTRSSNSTRHALEALLADCEGGAEAVTERLLCHLYAQGKLDVRRDGGVWENAVVTVCGKRRSDFQSRPYTVPPDTRCRPGYDVSGMHGAGSARNPFFSG